MNVVSPVSLLVWDTPGVCGLVFVLVGVGGFWFLFAFWLVSVLPIPFFCSFSLLLLLH